MEARGWKRRNFVLYDCYFLDEVGSKVICRERVGWDRILMRVMKVYSSHFRLWEK